MSLDISERKQVSVCNCKKRERRRGRHFGLCVRLLSCFVGVQTLAHLTTPPLKRGPPLLLVQQQQQQHITYNWPSASDQERGELSFPHTTVSLSWQRPLVFFTIMADRRHSKKNLWKFLAKFNQVHVVCDLDIGPLFTFIL